MTNPKTCSFSGYHPAKLPFKSDENRLACVHLKILLYKETEAADETDIPVSSAASPWRRP